MKKGDTFQNIVNYSTIIGLIIQCISIPKILQIVIALIVVALLIANSIRLSTVSNKKLVKKTTKLLMNSRGKVVFLGGDLSWTIEYKDIIRQITEGNQQVEIFFPREKITNAKKSVICRFNKNVEILKSVGATIYEVEKDIKIRCVLIDIDAAITGQDDLKIISGNRTIRCENNNKTRHRIIILDNKKKQDQPLCLSFYQNYLLLKTNCKPY